MAKTVRRSMGKRQRKFTLELDVMVVAIDSNYEPVTEAAFNYRQKHVYPYLEKQGFKIVRCQGQLARRYIVAPEVAKPNVDYLTGVGHGLANLYTGDQGDVIFQVGQYSQEEVNPKVVHFLSCQTARELGPDFVKHKCRAYFGYDVNFTFTWDDADIFFECDSEIDRAFADGGEAGKVFDRVKKLYEKRINELRNAGKDYTASTLETDLFHLCAPSVDARWGDQKAKLQ